MSTVYAYLYYIFATQDVKKHRKELEEKKRLFDSRKYINDPYDPLTEEENFFLLMVDELPTLEDLSFYVDNFEQYPIWNQSVKRYTNNTTGEYLLYQILYTSKPSVEAVKLLLQKPLPEDITSSDIAYKLVFNSFLLYMVAYDPEKKEFTTNNTYPNKEILNLLLDTDINIAYDNDIYVIRDFEFDLNIYKKAINKYLTLNRLKYISEEHTRNFADYIWNASNDKLAIIFERLYTLNDTKFMYKLIRSFLGIFASYKEKSIEEELKVNFDTESELPTFELIMQYLEPYIDQDFLKTLSGKTNLYYDKDNYTRINNQIKEYVSKYYLQRMQKINQFVITDLAELINQYI